MQRATARVSEIPLTLRHQRHPPLTSVSSWASNKILVITHRALASGCGFPDCILRRRLQIFGRTPPSVGTRQALTATGRSTLPCRKEPHPLGFQSTEPEKLHAAAAPARGQGAEGASLTALSLPLSPCTAHPRQEPARKSPRWKDICVWCCFVAGSPDLGKDKLRLECRSRTC